MLVSTTVTSTWCSPTETTCNAWTAPIPPSGKLLRLPNTKLRIQPLPAGKLAVMYGLQYNLGGIVVYDRETLTPNPEHFAQVEQGDSANDSTEIAEQGIDGTLVTHDQFVDAATGEVRSARELCPLPLLADVVWPAPAILRSKPRIYLWARTILLRRRMDQQPFITIDTLATAAGTQIAEVRQAAAISPFQPFAVNLSLKPGGKGIDGTLEFRELKRGKVIGSAELGKLNGRYSDYNDRIRPQLLLTKEKVVVVDYDRIVSAAIPADVKTKLAAPLALKIPKIPVASVDRPVEVQFEAHGDSNGRTFSLSRETTGLSMDAATGKLTVDLPKIWKRHTDVGGLSESLLPAVRQPKIDISAVFRRLTSSPLPPGKTAFRLPLRVTVANAAGESDELRLAMVVVAPKDEADKAEAELADLAAERDERYRRQEAASRAGVASVGFPPRANVEARLAQLEMRARRIEASLDAAIEKFDRMEKSLNGGEKGVPANEPPSPSGGGP